MTTDAGGDGRNVWCPSGNRHHVDEVAIRTVVQVCRMVINGTPDAAGVVVSAVPPV